MKNKILIGLIAFLVIAIIAVAGVLVYVNKNNSNKNSVLLIKRFTRNLPASYRLSRKGKREPD